MHRRSASITGLVLALVAVPGAVDAGPFESAAPVSAARLDGARGGFTSPAGLTVSLGIERLVSIDGQTVARHQADLGELGRLDGAQLAAARAALGSVQVVQNGPNNAVLAQLPTDTLGGVIIQNSLSDQVIRSQTVINTSVNSATLFKSLNFASSLADAVRGPLAPR